MKQGVARAKAKYMERFLWGATLAGVISPFREVSTIAEASEIDIDGTLAPTPCAVGWRPLPITFDGDTPIPTPAAAAVMGEIRVFCGVAGVCDHDPLTAPSPRSHSKHNPHRRHDSTAPRISVTDYPQHPHVDGSGAARRAQLTRFTASRTEAVSSQCDVISVAYLQEAVYWATNRDASGFPLRSPHPTAKPSTRKLTTGVSLARVQLSSGAHVLSTYAASWAPFAETSGLHVPSNVSVVGAADGSTVLTLAECLTPWPTGQGPASSSDPRHNSHRPAAANPYQSHSGLADGNRTPPPPPPCGTVQLGNFLLVSEYRIGRPNMSVNEQLTPATNVVLRDFAVQGGPLSPCSSPQDHGARAFNGISLNADGLLVESLSVAQVVVGINGGYFCQFLPGSDTIARNPNCSTDGWCEAKRLMLANAVIRNVNVCAAQQGITVIGRGVLVESNTVSLSTKTWTSPHQVFGVTMAVSAGFVGSSNVTVQNNTLVGGDYSVGADGSFPLWMSVPLFVNHWSNITAHYPAFKTEYPRGPAVDGRLVLNETDFILASQVLLDIASQYHAASPVTSCNEQGYNLGLAVRNNSCSGAVAGVSLYRTMLSDITDNMVVALPDQPLAKFGVILGNTHNTSVAENVVIGGWDDGVVIEGAGIADPRGCGPCQSRYGSAWNTVANNNITFTPSATSNPLNAGPVEGTRGITLGLTIDCGTGNVIRGNRVAGAVDPCNYTRALATVATGNTPASCNT